MLDSLDSVEPEVTKKTTVNHKRDNAIAYEPRPAGGRPDIRDSVMVSAMVREPEVRTTHDSKIVMTETTVTKLGDKQKNILGKVYEVLKKHEKQ